MPDVKLRWGEEICIKIDGVFVPTKFCGAIRRPKTGETLYAFELEDGRLFCKDEQNFQKPQKVLPQLDDPSKGRH